MSRVMVAPGQWRDEGPAVARSTTYRAWAVVPAVNVGHMRRILTGSSEKQTEKAREDKA